MFDTVEFCDKVFKVQHIKPGTIVRGTDEHGRWIFKALFGDRLFHAQFVFGVMKWGGHKGQSQVLMINLDSDSGTPRRLFYTQPFESYDDIVEVTNETELFTHLIYLYDYWHDFFKDFALASPGELKTFLPKPFGEMFEEDWLELYPDESDPEKSEKAHLAAYPWDRFESQLFWDMDEGAVFKAHPQFNLDPAQILAEIQQHDEYVGEEIQQLLKQPATEKARAQHIQPVITVSEMLSLKRP